MCLVVGSLDRGGAERQVVELARRLDRARFDVSIALLTHLGEMFEEVRAAGLPIDLVRPGEATSWSWVNWLRGLIARFEAERPHVVHGVLFPTYSLTALAAAKVGGIAAVAGLRSLGLGLEQRFPFRMVERIGHRVTACVVGNSEAVRTAAIRRDRWVARRIRVIHNGVDARSFGNGADAAEVRRELGLGERHCVVLMVANLIHYKGHRDAFRAFSLIRATNPDIRLVLAGGGPEEHELRRLATELGIGPDVVFLGVRRDVPRLLSAADIFLLASHEEGFPNAVLEAMASGLPVVATDVGGVPEQLDSAGCGLLVPAREPETLARAIGRLASDQDMRLAMGRAARQRATAEFSWDTAVARYSGLYEELAVSGSAYPAESRVRPR